MLIEIRKLTVLQMLSEATCTSEGWEITPRNVCDLSPWWSFSSPVVRGIWGYLIQWERKFLCLIIPTSTQNYFIACKATSFEWSSGRGEDLQQVQPALPSGPVDPEDLMVTRVYVTNGCHDKPVTSVRRGFTVFGIKTCSLPRLLPVSKAHPALLLGPWRDWTSQTSDRGPELDPSRALWTRCHLTKQVRKLDLIQK